MRLYYARGACSLSPHIVAREAGLPFQLVRVDTRTHRVEDGRDFHEVNPRGYVPVIELDDGSRLCEGAAIVQFLADAAPEAQLVPVAGTLARVRAQEWLNFIASEYHKQLIWMLRGAPPEVLSQQHAKVGKVLAELNHLLRERTFILGSSFSVVDAYAFAITRWCSLPQVMIDLEPYPYVCEYMARVADRPAVHAALIAEGLV
jgi:glutathione S-transferase